MLVLLPVRDNTASQVVFFIFFVLPPERHKVKQGAKAFQQRVKNQLFLLLLDRQLCKAAPWEPRMKYKDLKIVEMLIFLIPFVPCPFVAPTMEGIQKQELSDKKSCTKLQMQSSPPLPVLYM